MRFICWSIRTIKTITVTREFYDLLNLIGSDFFHSSSPNKEKYTLLHIYIHTVIPLKRPIHGTRTEFVIVIENLNLHLLCSLLLFFFFFYSNRCCFSSEFIWRICLVVIHGMYMLQAMIKYRNSVEYLAFNRIPKPDRLRVMYEKIKTIIIFRLLFSVFIILNTNWLGAALFVDITKHHFVMPPILSQ